MKRTLSWVLMLALVLSLATAGCKKKPEVAAGGKKGGGKPAFPVEVITVDAKPHDVLITSPGTVDAFERIQVTARVSGVLDRVNFTEGQEVRKGQVLAFIDSRRYALNVSSARAAVAKSEATVADVEASLRRRENASTQSPGLIPGEELETFKTKLRTANADADGTREALKLAQLNLEDSSVRALSEGVIQTRNVETGQYVQAGTIIATLLRRDPMLLHFHATTAEAPKIKVGTPVTFMLKESQVVYDAVVTLVAAAAEADSRLVPITAEVRSEKKFWLRPGSFAMITIKLAPEKLFPLVPQIAARPSDKGFLGYVVDGENVHERVLQLGLHTAEGWVEVRDGLKVGEVLVTKGIEALAEGTRVQVVQPGAERGGASSGAAPVGSGGRRKGRDAGAEAP